MVEVIILMLSLMGSPKLCSEIVPILRDAVIDGYITEQEMYQIAGRCYKSEREDK